MFTFLLNFFLIGSRSLPTHIFNSASKSKRPAVSMLNLVMLQYGTERYSIFFPVSPWTSTKIKRLFVKMKVSLMIMKLIDMIPNCIKDVGFHFHLLV